MNQIIKKEIENREDVELLVNRFYQRVRKDDLIGPIFNEKIGKHWAEHLKKLYDFWESRLFRTDAYSGRPLMKHQSLPIDSPHFDRWLKLWGETIDDYFVGELADMAKSKAGNIASFFQEKLGITRPE